MCVCVCVCVCSRVDDFCSAFPYHIVLDENMSIRQCGNNIRRITLATITDGMPFTQIGHIVQPVIDQTMDNIFKFINAVFIIAIYRNAGEGDRPFLLKGGWLARLRACLLACPLACLLARVAASLAQFFLHIHCWVESRGKAQPQSMISSSSSSLSSSSSIPESRGSFGNHR